MEFEANDNPELTRSRDCRIGELTENREQSNNWLALEVPVEVNDDEQRNPFCNDLRR
jgi:hypothetical protein